MTATEVVEGMARLNKETNERIAEGSGLITRRLLGGGCRAEYGPCSAYCKICGLVLAPFELEAYQLDEERFVCYPCGDFYRERFGMELRNMRQVMDNTLRAWKMGSVRDRFGEAL